MKRIVEIVCQKLGKNFDEFVITTEGRVGEDKQYWLDSSKLFKDTNWSPKITLEHGIEETVDWVKKNLDSFDDENLSFRLRA